MNQLSSQNLRTQAVIRYAIKLANVSVCLGLVAIAYFVVFGTLASLPQFKDSTVIYLAFHYLPYVLIGLSIPISLYQVFLLWRYRIVQMGILAIIMGVGVGLFLFALGAFVLQGKSTTFFMSLFLAMIAWFAMPFLFRVNFKKFLTFLQQIGN